MSREQIAPDVRLPRVVGSFEWFDTPTGEDCQCARCGGEVESVNCWNCGGEGYSHHDCGEDSCCCLYPEDNVTCDACQGNGFFLHCTNSPEWCRDNPRPGREHIESTAMTAEAWLDD
jgi:hypothetical protein